LPAPTISGLSDGVASSALSDATSSREPAVTRITLWLANIGAVLSSTSSRAGSSEIAIVEADNLGLAFAALDEDLRKRYRALRHEPRIRSVDGIARQPGSAI
jgi:hypothetical protein